MSRNTNVRARYSGNKRRGIAAKKHTSGNISRRNFNCPTRFLTVVNADGTTTKPDNYNNQLVLKPSSVPPLKRPLTEKMNQILLHRGVLPNDKSVTFPTFPPLREKVRSLNSHNSYESTMNSFYKWCICIGDEESAICVTDNVPDRGVPIPVPSPKSLITYCQYRRFKKDSLVNYDGKNVLDITKTPPQPIYCIKSWDALNEDKFLSVLGSALHARSIDIESYTPSCHECLFGNPPRCNHLNRDGRYAKGFAKISHKWSDYYESSKLLIQNRIPKATYPLTPFQTVDLGKAVWHSGDFYLVYIYTIFLHMIWAIGRSELALTKIYEDIVTSLDIPFCEGSHLNSMTWNMKCKNRDQLFTIYRNCTKLGEWICPLTHFFYISSCTKLKSGYIFPCKKAICIWINGGFVGSPDNSNPMSYKDFNDDLKILIKNVLNIEGNFCLVFYLFVI